MLKQNINELDIKKIAAEAQSISINLSSSIVDITYDEMKKLEDQKTKTTDIFYNKINILNAICSALLSGNLILLQYFAEKTRFIESIFSVACYGLSTILIVIVMIMLLSNMRFRKSYYEINELKYIKSLSKILTSENVKRANIAAIVTKNYQRNKNLEKMKKSLKYVTNLLSISIVLTVICSVYMVATKNIETGKTKSQPTKVEILKMPEMKLYYQSGEYIPIIKEEGSRP